MAGLDLGPGLSELQDCIVVAGTQLIFRRWCVCCSGSTKMYEVAVAHCPKPQNPVGVPEVWFVQL